jgi:hypothetical protein
MGRTKGIKNSRKMHIWTNEEKIYMAEITPGNSHKDILRLMCEKFNYDFTMTQITSAIKRYNLNTGRTGRYEKGRIPYNKGTKGIMKPNKTSFKKGDIPANHREVGSERINVYGYTEVKVAEPNKWKLKHRVIYEEHYGEIPKNHNVIFADGNKLNLDINNLVLVNKDQLLVLNKNELIKDNADLTKAGVNVANLMIKIRDINNKRKG